LRAGARAQHVSVHPVGIDPAVFLPRVRPPAAAGERPPGRGGTRRRPGGERKVALGVDRLDYTKGIPERMLAFETFLRQHPHWERKVSLVQIAAPSRTKVRTYAEHRRTIDELVGRINGELAEHDWMPIRYLYRTYAREELARFYRDAEVGLVTPLRDGMNLVAKEYVAAQRPEDPGVLVLSRFAGAADELDEALIVNPYVPADTARGLAEALAMPLDERRSRHQALLARVLEMTARDWARAFLAELSDLRPARGAARGSLPAPPGVAAAGARER
jgi:trehalose 6-phosphate synthase